MLGLIQIVTYSVSTLDSSVVLYYPLIKSEINMPQLYRTSTEAKKLERIQRNFVALCHNRFFTCDQHA
jgi:hypothetical protein